jgi:DNA-binding LacI/PurR family transcriptional regulator
VTSKPQIRKATRQSRATTLADVAAMAGVVPMTASRAINQSGYVSAVVRDRVLAAARKLKYRPNIIARQLRGSRLNAIGVILPDIANPFSAELMRGINVFLREAGYACFIGTTDNSPDEQRVAMQAFVDHRVDGLILATPHTQMGDAAVNLIAQQGIPIVVLGQPHEIPAVDCVSVDDWQGSFDLAQHLAGAGHQQIGFIGWSSESPVLRRFEGFQQGIKAAGLTFNPEHAVAGVIGPGWATEEDGFRGLMALMNHKRPPTAVMCRNDAAAIGALHAAYVLGLKVPKDIAIAGFDNIPLAAFQSPPLTTVEQPIKRQGETAAQLLINRIQGDHRAPRKTVRMNCTLIVRESTQATTA